MDKRLALWFAGRDTGTSSTSIALWLAAGVASYGPPSDVSDLGRCMRLLDAMPEWKARMAEMAGAGDRWKPFAERWNDLTTLYEEERGGERMPRTYAFMQVLHGRPGRQPGLHIELAA